MNLIQISAPTVKLLGTRFRSVVLRNVMVSMIKKIILVTTTGLLLRMAQAGLKIIKKWTKKDDPPGPSKTVNSETPNPTSEVMITSHVELGDRNPHFEPVPYFTTTSGAMQISGFDLPSGSNVAALPRNISLQQEPLAANSLEEQEDPHKHSSPCQAPND